MRKLGTSLLAIAAIAWLAGLIALGWAPIVAGALAR